MNPAWEPARRTVLTLLALCSLGCAGAPRGDASSDLVAIAIQSEAADAVLSGSVGFLRSQDVEWVCFGAAALGPRGSVVTSDAATRRMSLQGAPRRDQEATDSVLAGMHGQGFELVPLYDCRQAGRAFFVERTAVEAVVLRVDSPGWLAPELVNIRATFDHEDFTYTMSCRMLLDEEGWWVDYCRCARSRGPDACLSIG